MNYLDLPWDFLDLKISWVQWVYGCLKKTISKLTEFEKKTNFKVK